MENVAQKGSTMFMSGITDETGPGLSQRVA